MPPEASESEFSFVSRGGLKLQAAVDAFSLDPSGWICVDLGCSTGGFTDCLLQAGADRVFAIDTAYGELAWKLRQDERVTVMERTNALHAEVPEGIGCDLAVIDLGWTPQRLAVPAAARWLAPGGQIVSLVKPHYEVSARDKGARVVLDEAQGLAETERALQELHDLGYERRGLVASPILGGKRKGKKRGGSGKGNREWLALLGPSGAGISCSPGVG